jgi:hypothetical protein
MQEAELKARLEAGGAGDWAYKATNGLVYAEQVEPPEPLIHLFRYLIGCECIVSVHPDSA